MPRDTNCGSATACSFPHSKHGFSCRTIRSEEKRIDAMATNDEEGREAVERIREALRDLRFGAVTAIVHEGVVVQVERTEKLRLVRSDRGTGS
jgi:hypothetical protein